MRRHGRKITGSTINFVLGAAHPKRGEEEEKMEKSITEKRLRAANLRVLAAGQRGAKRKGGEGGKMKELILRSLQLYLRKGEGV